MLTISYTVTGEQRRARQLFLRIACYITAHNSQAHAETETLEIAQPQGNEATPFVGCWKCHEHRGADDAEQIGDSHRDAA
jgi:hypothetical protein